MSLDATEPRLKSSRFRHEREGDWRQLEHLLGKAERGSLSSLTADEVVSLTVLYRAALSSLSVARATSLDRSLVDYLESLSTRAYFFVYGARTSLLGRLGGFFARDWPLAIQALWRETLLGVLITALGTATAYVLVMSDLDWFYGFVPRSLADGRDPTAPTSVLKEALYHSEDFKAALTAFAAFLFNHNATLAILSFALGFAFGAPTILLLLGNGLMLGAFLALHVSRGLGFEVGGWLVVHSVTEIFAIILAGAGGLRIGWAIAFPGARSRVDAASTAGRLGALAMCGAILMLFVAGLLESFARTLVTDDYARYAIGVGTAVFWALYFYWPRRRRVHGQD